MKTTSKLTTAIQKLHNTKLAQINTIAKQEKNEAIITAIVVTVIVILSLILL